MLWIYFDRQGVAKCKVNSGNKIRQGDSFGLAVYIEGTNEGTEDGWGVYSISYIKPGNASPVGLTAPAQTSEETYYLGDPSQANFYFKNGTTYKVWKATVPSTATSIVSNGGNLGLIITLSDTPSSTSTDVSQKRMETISVYLEPTYGSKPLSMTYDDYSNLIKLYTNYDPVFVHGTGTNAVQQIGGALAYDDHMAAVGKYNEVITSGYATLFVVGNGKDDSNRSNAFRVLSDGRAKLSGSPADDDDVATVATVNDYKNSTFVYKPYKEDGDIQVVESGLYSRYTGTDSMVVCYGTTSDGFEILVQNADDDIDGTLRVQADYWTCINGNGTGWLVTDNTDTTMRSYDGTGKLRLGSNDFGLSVVPEANGKQVYAVYADKNGTYLYDPSAGGTYLKVSSGHIDLRANNASFGFYNDKGTGGLEFINGNSLVAYVPLSLRTDPTEDDQATHKKYVDAQDASVENKSINLVNDLREDLEAQIDAINASQNFVATYAKKADMPTPPVSGLEEKDCVLVLKDEDHQDQAYVYKYNSAGWAEVGPLGDYYTKAQINDMFTNDQHIYVSEDGFVCVDYDKLPVRA